MSFGINSDGIETKLKQNEYDISEMRNNSNSRVNFKILDSGNDPLSIYKTAHGGMSSINNNLFTYEKAESHALSGYEGDNNGTIPDDARYAKKKVINSKSLEDLSLFEPFHANLNPDKKLNLTNINDKTISGDLNSNLSTSNNVNNSSDNVTTANSNSGRVSGLFSTLASTVTQNISSQIQNALRETKTNMINNGNLKSNSKNKSNSELFKWNDILTIINQNRNAYSNMNIKKNSDSIEILGIDKSESELISKNMNLTLYPGESIKMFYKECGISTQYGLPNPIYGSFLITNYRIILAPLYEKGENNKFFNIVRRHSLLWMYKSGFFNIPISCINSCSINTMNGFNFNSTFFSSGSTFSDSSKGKCMESKTEDTKKGEIEVSNVSVQEFGLNKNNINNYYNSYPCLLDISTRDLRYIQILIVQSDKERRFLHNYIDKIINETICNNFFCYIAYNEKRINERLFKFDIVSEYKRMGLNLENQEFQNNNDAYFPLRISFVNNNYELCNSYPKIIVVPRDISDNQLIKISGFRSKNRIPILSWMNPNLKCTLWRSSQPKSAFKRCFEDELLITTISKYYNDGNSNNVKNFTIYDARPKLNAYANKATGAGFENVDDYPYCKLEFLNIENIHKVRDSWNKMVSVIQKISNFDSYCSCKSNSKHHLNEYILELNNKRDEVGDINNYISLLEKITFNENNGVIGIRFYSDIDSTGWYDLISMILMSSNKIVNQLINSKGVLVHCSDGWDRTSQLTALSMICIDPYYRTIKGFITLIEKEFITLGHKFHSRCGTLGLSSSNENERSPIFIQWLDCIYQCIVQFPNEFQFNSNLLLFVAEQLNNSLFGNFICDSDYERNSINSKELTLSLWDTILKYSNELYTKHNNDCSDSSSSDVRTNSDYSPPIGVNPNIFYHSGFINTNYKYNSKLSIINQNNEYEYFNYKLINCGNILVLDPTSIKVTPWLQFWLKFSPMCLRTI
ncbi:myotubularin related 1 [Cryptosporidium xiaoi]|uniref:Myotubularin related 1 n=1 Tax=Cryptosporidium xiaoi TaxID=659607 RepID=A0AAV9XY00_9CRYT